VTADKSTNSLIVFGSAEYIKTIEQVVKKLDVRRPQVFVQALIMEMTLEKSLDLGVRWQASSQAGDAVLGAGNPNAAPQTLTDALGGGTGAAIGILGNEINFQGQKFVSFSAFIQATRQDQDLNVLANPQILTLNNEEAEINVSQVIPVSAKVVTNIANQTTTEFEFKDVGIILKIKPTITGDDKVRLTINQESSSVAARQTTISATQQAITTLKRKISTHVLVDDASTMAIGGLIQDQQVETETKVPCLGDIPVLGWFFKSRNESVRKTNLIVFIRPQIIHTREGGAAATNEAQRRYDATRGLRKDTEDTLRGDFGLPAQPPPPDKDAKDKGAQ
jgi:general secretion pathway protein D